MGLSSLTGPEAKMVEDAIETIENVIVETELVQMLGVRVIVFLMDILVQLIQNQRRLKTRILMSVVRLLVLINIRLLIRGREMARKNREMGVILLTVEGRDRGRVHSITGGKNGSHAYGNADIKFGSASKKLGLPLHGSNGKSAFQPLHPHQVQKQAQLYLREADLRENVTIHLIRLMTLLGGQEISLRICFNVNN